MTREQILNHLNTNIPYTMYGHKVGYLKSEWHRFKPESLKILQSIKANEMPYLELDVTNSLLRLKRKI